MNEKKLDVAVIIAVKNEEINIRNCLSSLKPATRIIVIDSYSEDLTAEIAKDVGAEVYQFDFTGGYPKKRQWALDTIYIAEKWVMLVDADEMIPESLWTEMTEIFKSQKKYDAYMVKKGFHFYGKKFKYGGFSHEAVLVFKNGKGRFEELVEMPANSQDMEVHERIFVEGSIGRLRNPLIHKDFKGIQAYIGRHNHYSTWEAKLRYNFLKTGTWGKDSIKPGFLGNSQERRRYLKRIAIRLPFEPMAWFIYHYIFCLGFLEGRPGWIASLMRAFYIAQVKAKMYELHLEEQKRRKNR